jgi:hypothetical protein
MKTSMTNPKCCQCGAEAIGFYYSDARFYSLYCPAGCHDVQADTPDEAAYDWAVLNKKDTSRGKVAAIAVLAVVVVGALAGLVI